MGVFTAVRGGRLVDSRGHNGEALDILVEGDTIRELGPPGLAAPEGAETFDAAGTLVLPGLVNAHTHGDASFAKGLGDRWTLELLLNASPLSSEAFNLEDKYLAAQLAAVEMVLNGCTACYDLFSDFPAPGAESLSAVGQAYADVGIRAAVAPLMADRNFWQAIPGLLGALPERLRREVDRIAHQPEAATLARLRAALKAWPFPRDQVRLALAPTIPHHCADSFFRACRALADEFGVGIHSHLAESKVQAVVGQKLFGKSLAAHLDDLGVIGPDFTGAHCVWLDADDEQRLADRGASVAHNPTSNLRLGVGIARTRTMRDRGIAVGVGTDASSCSDGLNMFEAMRLAAYVSRAHSPDPELWLGAEDALRMATEGSARALGFEGLLGRIAPGYKADLVFLDADAIQYLPLNHAVRQVVFQETGRAVRDVMVGGRMVVRDGNVATVDTARLRAKVEAATARLTRKAARAEPLIRALEPLVGHFCVGLSKQPFHVERYVGA